MAETKPTYLTPARPAGDPVEIQFVKEQAEFYNHLWNKENLDALGLILVPACPFCASDDLIEDHCRMSFHCRNCMKESTADVIRAGRLARR